MADSDVSRSMPTRWRWRSFSLRSLAILVTISAVILAALTQQIRERWLGPQLSQKVIHNVGELHEAIRAKRSVIYCDKQWSINSAHGLIVFQGFARDWPELMPNTQIEFYLLDLTEPNDEAVEEAIRLWGEFPSSGSGELLWVRDGAPRDYTFGTEHHSHASLAGIAQKAFGLSSVARFQGEPTPNQ